MIFCLSMVAWAVMMAVQGEWLSAQEYLPFLCGLVLIAGVSFVDDIRSLPDCVRRCDEGRVCPQDGDSASECECAL